MIAPHRQGLWFYKRDEPKPQIPKYFVSIFRKMYFSIFGSPFQKVHILPWHENLRCILLYRSIPNTLATSSSYLVSLISPSPCMHVGEDTPVKHGIYGRWKQRLARIGKDKWPGKCASFVCFPERILGPGQQVENRRKGHRRRPVVTIIACDQSKDSSRLSCRRVVRIIWMTICSIAVTKTTQISKTIDLLQVTM
jgi:hypothetical protein